MPDFFLEDGKRIRLKPEDAFGKGGEADIYADGNFALKIFKQPTHIDLSGDPEQQRAALERLKEHQQKLPAFPRGLPPHVITPEGLIYNAKREIVGYRMPLLQGAEVLYLYGQPNSRSTGGIKDETAINALLDLHATVAGLHQKKVVIGDFNDLNVLVKGNESFLIDADSMQFAHFLTNVFMTKFVDPLNCDPKLSTLSLVKPHSIDSDWYAYAIMLMQTLLFVGPYGGVYRPKDLTKKVTHDARPLKRITVFNPEVTYPKPARPFGILPDDVLQYFQDTFLHDERGVTPRKLLENLRFTICMKCGKTHARGLCPSCVQASPPMQKMIHKGGISAFKEFSTDGVILYTTMQDRVLRYLYHEQDVYKREGGAIVLKDARSTNLRFRISGEKTIIGRGTMSYLFQKGKADQFNTSAYGQIPLFDGNGRNVFFVKDSGLFRIGDLGNAFPDRWGTILPGQTLFWVGDENGFGFYRAGELSNFFVFGTKHPGLNDSVKLPGIKGQLIDATCRFGADRIWFFTTTAEGGHTINRCHVMRSRGEYLASAETIAGDGTWLGSIRGNCAFADFLLVATDEGIKRVELVNNFIQVVKEFPATAEFVDAETNILPGKDGLYVANERDIWRLVLK